MARNFRTRFGEIDLVFKEKDCLVFVEVKTRRDVSYGQPEEAVTRAKQKHLAAAAMIYLNKKKTPDALWRIDVISLLQTGDGFNIRHLKNAAAF